MLISKNTKQIKYYKSLDNLKILTYWKIINDKNILLLDFDYYENKKYSKDQLNELEQNWLRLYDEYYVLTDDSKSKSKMDKTFDELKLRDKVTQLKNNYDFLNIHLKGFVGLVPDVDISKYEQETYNNVKTIDKRIKLRIFEGIDVNLNIISRAIDALINRYNQQHKDNVKEVQKEIDNVYTVVANAESWLAPQPIFINDMVCSHWIAIEQQVKQKQKASQNNGK